MRQIAKRLSLLVVLMTLLGACLSQSEVPSPALVSTPSLPAAAPTEETPTMLVVVSPDLSDNPTDAPTTVPLDATLPVQTAVATLAREMDVPEGTIGLVEALPVQWTDSSLGCPQPGEVYLDVVTQGYLITLSVGEETYHVHTDLSGTAVVCFNQDDAVGEGTVRDPVVAEFIAQAKADLAARLGVAVDAITLVRSEAVEWTDASLGCREPGAEYAAVLVPGYRIILAFEDQFYEYHTDYQYWFFCENPTE